MSFRVEILFTGLGVLQITTREKRSRHPTSVEFLALRSGPMVATTGGHAHGAEHAVHQPRLTFCLSDLTRPDATRFPIQPTHDGLLVVPKSIENQQVQIEVDGGEPAEWDLHWAADPNPLAPSDATALDWIPDLEAHLGLDMLIGSGHSKAPSVYASRVLLPPGRLESRHLLVAEDGTPRRWHFDKGETHTNPLFLAEEVVWSRRGVESLRVGVDWPPLEFDGRFQELRNPDEEPVVRLAVTSMPDDGFSGRFNQPAHLPMFHTVSESGRDPWVLEPVVYPPGEICSHAVCPPTKREIVVP